jgi:type II secretory pathway pseudopilin PulG
VRVRRRKFKGANDRGFALVALLAGLTIMLVMMAVAMPSIKHDLQREQEEEMFWRGQQMAMGLAKFASFKGRLPTDLKEVGEKFESPVGPMRFVRKTALCDPLRPCDGKSNWKAVRRGDPLISEFYQAYLAEMMRNPDKGLRPPSQELAQMAKLSAQSISGLNPDGQQGGPSTSEFSKDLKIENGPIYGVVSQDPRELIRNYFDLGTYDHALFFTGIAVSIPGIYSPLVFAPPTQTGGQAGNERQQDSRCPNGGIYFEQDGKGFCGGVVNQGKYCHGPDGTTVLCADLKK